MKKVQEPTAEILMGVKAARELRGAEKRRRARNSPCNSRIWGVSWRLSVSG